MFIYTRQGRCTWTWCLVLAGAGASKAVAAIDRQSEYGHWYVKLQDGVSPSWSDLRQTTHPMCETVDNEANCWRKSQPKRGHFILLTVSAVSRSNHNGQMQKWKIKGCNCRYQSHVNTAPQGPPSEMTQKGQLLLQDKNLWHMHATI